VPAGFAAHPLVGNAAMDRLKGIVPVPYRELGGNGTVFRSTKRPCQESEEELCPAPTSTQFAVS
jgi:hypothetical protein